MAASKTCYIESLGCAKNLVDSESMAGLLAQDGYSSIENPARADVLVVNTCGFIAAARAESLQALQRLSARKRKGQILIAAGCLTQRDCDLVAREVPGLDGILSTRRWMDIVDLLHTIRQSPARSGSQRLSKDRGWLPASLRVLLHSPDQRHGRQPSGGIYSFRSQIPCRK
jgi:ribosomal protein S12 methylthiotransferase